MLLSGSSPFCTGKQSHIYWYNNRSLLLHTIWDWGLPSAFPRTLHIQHLTANRHCLKQGGRQGSTPEVVLTSASTPWHVHSHIHKRIERYTQVHITHTTKGETMMNATTSMLWTYYTNPTSQWKQGKTIWLLTWATWVSLTQRQKSRVVFVNGWG